MGGGRAVLNEHGFFVPLPSWYCTYLAFAGPSAKAKRLTRYIIIFSLKSSPLVDVMFSCKS